MKRQKRGIRKSLIVINLIVLVMSLVGFLYYWLQYQEAKNLYQQLDQVAYLGQTQAASVSALEPLRIDHESLRAVNPDYVGWIEIEGTAIRYPIAKGLDNAFYLERAFDGRKSIAGSIFLDVNNQSAFTDTNTMVYGHHMKDKSMFGALEKYLDQAFFESHPRIYVATPEEIIAYEIFASYEVQAGSRYYQPGILSAAELTDYLKLIETSAYQYKDVMFRDGDTMITLITCGYSIEDARIIVHGKRVDSKN